MDLFVERKLRNANAVWPPFVCRAKPSRGFERLNPARTCLSLVGLHPKRQMAQFQASSSAASISVIGSKSVKMKKRK
jgi:hypothetical protein